MAPPYRLIATDIDGTLQRTNGKLSPYTADVLTRIIDRGVPIVLVTGRPIRWLGQLYDQLPEPLPAICANGAVVYDPIEDVVLRANPLAPELLGDIVRRLRAEVPGVTLAAEVRDGREMWHEADYPLHWDGDQPDLRSVKSLDELLTAPAVKLLARGSYDADAFLTVVAAALAGLAEATHSSYSGLVEISAAGVTKAAGLAWYCEQLGIDAVDVLAFGDMPNDVPMLTWAGRGVAVANAHSAVLKIADEVTGSNDEDGVASYLSALFPA